MRSSSAPPSTPTPTRRCPPSRWAKPVYCEKPLTRDVAEARAITQAAEKAGVATQMGTQIHGMPNYRRVVELIQSGAIGNVSEVHVWVSRAWGLQSREEAKANRDIVYVTDRPKESMTPPADLDWDLWIGPAPYRPFNTVYVPGPKWYRWWDFGNGTMSDLGSHWIDLPFWALKLDAPLTVEADGPKPHPEIAPASMKAKYEYGPRGDLPACTLTWYQGTYKPANLAGQRHPAVEQRRLVRGRERHAAFRLRQARPLAGEGFQRLRRPQTVPARLAGPASGMAHRLQNRQTHQQPLPLLRPS